MIFNTTIGVLPTIEGIYAVLGIAIPFWFAVHFIKKFIKKFIKWIKEIKKNKGVD